MLVDTIRALLHTRLSTLRIKTKRLDELLEHYHEKIEKKNIELNRIRSTLSDILVYIENAYFFDKDEVKSTLGLPSRLPAMTAKLIAFAKDVVQKTTDNKSSKFPLPEEYLYVLRNSLKNLEPLMKDFESLNQQRHKLVADRDQTLSEFREILPPIRKWLWQTLPEGRSDPALINYGFKPYGC